MGRKHSCAGACYEFTWPAQGVLSDLEAADRADYQRLVRALLNRFEPEHQSKAFRAQLKARQRRRGEPLAE